MQELELELQAVGEDKQRSGTKRGYPPKKTFQKELNSAVGFSF